MYALLRDGPEKGSENDEILETSILSKKMDYLERE